MDYSEPEGSQPLMDLLSYYYADRLYLLRSINLILSHRPRPGDKPDIILQRQSGIDGEKLLDQLDQLLKTTPVPARSRDLNSQMISIMHLQHLRERATLLESLLLFVENTPLSDSGIDRIFKLSKKNFFLLNPSSSYLVDSAIASKLTELSAVLLQLMLIKTITRIITTSPSDKQLKELDSNLSMLQSTEIKILAPLQLAWAMVRFLNSDYFASKDENAAEVTGKLARIAFDAGVWKVSRTVLEMPQLSQNITSRAANDAILSLIDSSLQSFDAESAGTTYEIAQTIVTCFEHEKISAEFWAKFDLYSDEEDSGLKGFIASQVKLLPLDFEITIQILASSASSTVGASMVSKLFNGVAYLTEQISGDETSDEIISFDSGSKWKLKEDRHVAGFTIPAGSDGELFHGHLGAIVQWRVAPVSGWNLLGLILSGTHHSDVTISSIKLYTRCFKSDTSNLHQLLPHISKLFKCSVSNFGYDNNIDLVLQLCECLLVLSDQNPEYCLELMSRIFPQCRALKKT